MPSYLFFFLSAGLFFNLQHTLCSVYYLIFGLVAGSKWLTGRKSPNRVVFSHVALMCGN